MFLDTVKDFMEILSSRTVQNINFVEEEYFDEDYDVGGFEKYPKDDPRGKCAST